MNKIINWGLLSTARINRALIKPLRASRRTRLLGVASRSLSAADAYAREWRIPRAYGSYDDLLADPEIDVVYNPLPNHLHAEWTVKALHAGKHVLCEKPLAITLNDVDAIIAASRETGRIATEAFMYRHHAQTLKVKQLVDSGMIGQLQNIKGAFSFTLSRPNDIRFVKEYGGGSLWDVGCYPISYARMLVGEEPLEVFGSQVTGLGGTDESFYGQMRFGSGVHAQFDCGFKSQTRSYIEVIGTEGAIHVPSPFKPEQRSEITLTLERKSSRIRIKGQELYLGEVEDICDAIEKQSPPRVSLQDSRANVAAILALAKSAEAGSPVNMGDFV